jgi:pyochelin biosynthetic protein PchC
VCFPHAGGCASFYKEWSSTLPPAVDLWAVQYPGREDRINDPWVNELRAIAASIVVSLQPLLDAPLALFGHSMGAAVACEVARQLEAARPEPVARLFVSAQPPPHRRKAATNLHLKDDGAVIAELSRLGLAVELVQQHPELLALILPAVRKDYEMDEGHRASSDPKLRCPITALSGDADPECDALEMLAWQDCTRSTFELVRVAGNHFYLVPERKRVLQLIAERLNGNGHAVHWPSTP